MASKQQREGSSRRSRNLDIVRLGQLIKPHFDALVGRMPDLADLVAKLRACGSVVVFGGYVRDRIHNAIHGENVSSRDLDFVVDGEIQFSPESAQINNFGGRRNTIDGGLKVDYWELKSTYAFKRHFFEPTLQNLPRTTVYLPNACLYDVSGGSIVESGAIDSIESKIVGFNCREYLGTYPEYQAFRAIDLARRLSYNLDQEVHEFVRRALERTNWLGFCAAVQKHRPELTSEQIQSWCKPYI